MTVALREPSSTPVAENTVDIVTEQAIPQGPCTAVPIWLSPPGHPTTPCSGFL